MTDSEQKTSSSENNATENAGREDPVLLEWVVHPVRRKPWVSILVTLFVAAIGATVHGAMESHFFTILALVILLASLAKFYFPTTFKFSERGVTVKTTTQSLFKEWKLYRSSYRDRKGILLSPFVGKTRMENFRGLYVMFEGNGDRVTAIVEERIKLAHNSEVESESKPPETEGPGV